MTIAHVARSAPFYPSSAKAAISDLASDQSFSIEVLRNGPIDDKAPKQGEGRLPDARIGEKGTAEVTTAAWRSGAAAESGDREGASLDKTGFGEAWEAGPEQREAEGRVQLEEWLAGRDLGHTGFDTEDSNTPAVLANASIASDPDGVQGGGSAQGVSGARTDRSPEVSYRTAAEWRYSRAQEDRMRSITGALEVAGMSEIDGKNNNISTEDNSVAAVVVSLEAHFRVSNKSWNPTAAHDGHQVSGRSDFNGNPPKERFDMAIHRGGREFSAGAAKTLDVAALTEGLGRQERVSAVEDGDMQVSARLTPQIAGALLGLVGWQEPSSGSEPSPIPMEMNSGSAEAARGGDVTRSLVIRLDPKDLGQVDVRVTLRGSSVRVHMAFDNERAANSVRAVQDELADILVASGVDVTSLVIDGARLSHPADPRNATSSQPSGAHLSPENDQKAGGRENGTNGYPQEKSRQENSHMPGPRAGAPIEAVGPGAKDGIFV